MRGLWDQMESLVSLGLQRRGATPEASGEVYCPYGSCTRRVVAGSKGRATMPPSDTSYQTRDVRHFEEWSRTYEGSWMQNRLFNRVHLAVLELAAPLPPPAQVLDVGCGTGRLLRAAGMRWPEAELIGVDPAQGMVDEARRLTPAATFRRGLAESLPLPDASVDLAVSTLSSHHWRDPGKGVGEIA